MRCLAIDLGGTKIAAALVENQHISQRMQIATPTTAVAKTMEQRLHQLLQSYQGQFDYVALASTGIIQQGVLTALNPANLGGLAEFPLYTTLAKQTDKPIFLLNDAQAAAFAEYRQQTALDFAFITVSTGVGGGLVLDGKLQTGSRGVAGHIGHTLADPNGAVCGCGRQGCVEVVASGRAIEQVAGVAPKLVFERFRQNEPEAREIIQRSAKAIAQLCADLVIGLDIRHIAIGGSVGLADGFLPLVVQYQQQLPTIYHCPLTPAVFGADAGLIGVALWGEQQLLGAKK